MIKISRATKKDTSSWSEKEWHKLDLIHYGKEVKFDNHPFRFKAVDKDKLAGLITGDVENGVMYITYIITAEGLRGQGIGTNLMMEAEKFGKRHNAHIVWLVTGKNWSENTFYQKLGFKLTATLPNFNFHKDFVIYTKLIK